MAKPLRILTIGPALPCIESLRKQGHIVNSILDSPFQQKADERVDALITSYDLILGPTCCRFLPGMEAYLPSIIKGVRKVKYPAKEKA